MTIDDTGINLLPPLPSYISEGGKMVYSGVPAASNYPSDSPCGALAETMDRLTLTDHWMNNDQNNDIAEEPEVAQIIKQKRTSDRLPLQTFDAVNGHEKESFQCKSALADILKSHTPP